MDMTKWIAVQNNDSTADGKFYYGVRTTRIFCLPSCKSKLPLKENIVFFHSYQHAINLGFRPCKRCRPDLYSTYAPNEKILLEIKDFLDKFFLNPQCLKGLNERFNVSTFHLVRIFKNRFGLTPREYVLNNRLQAAKNLLTCLTMKTVDIAFNCGFSSYTTFFTNFKKLSGLTPEEYRKGGIL